jgi:regulator of sirC expression with transglutaminase-like and TPR domain
MIHEIAHLGLLDDEAIILDAAALELAALDHPEIDLAPYGDELASFADRLAADAGDARTARERAGALARLLAESEGFRGDRATYDDPDNADLIRVLDRRRGLPVTLSIVYVALARRVGWAADALNTPGHVLVRIGSDTEPLLIDPFNAGAIVGAGQLARLLSQAGVAAGRVAPEHLEPMSNRSVLVRLITNQASRAEAAGEAERALILYQRMTTVAPAQPHGWWQRARLELAQGEVAAARASLSGMLEITRDPELRAQVGAALEALHPG